MFNGVLTGKFESCYKYFHRLLDLSVIISHNIKEKNDSNKKLLLKKNFAHTILVESQVKVGKMKIRSTLFNPYSPNHQLKVLKCLEKLYFNLRNVAFLVFYGFFVGVNRPCWYKVDDFRSIIGKIFSIKS